MASPYPDSNRTGPDPVHLQRQSLLARFHSVRQRSEEICRPLEPEDFVIQSMADVSPPKWHLAHTSWFFEAFILQIYNKGYRTFHPRYAYLFNSYYQTVGQMHPRARRGLLSRPTIEEVYRYRAYVNEAMAALIEETGDDQWQDTAFRITLGLHHEQQHQELLLTDIKHIFANNPLRPAYRPGEAPAAPPAPALRWSEQAGGLKMIGHVGGGFAYDNETPRHRVYLDDYHLASRLVTNGEYLEFMEAGGYRAPELWLSDGWATVQSRRWETPLYWERIDGQWWQMTLAGMQPVDPNAPVCHVSLYEADAYARWKGARLPTEAEWETAANTVPIQGNFYEQGRLRPCAAGDDGTPLLQMFGDAWEWTQSPYAPYPGFKALSGSLGEYNGKFMCNQLVLRGGSCVTAASHMRATYRNFFYPPDRWQFTAIRLAQTP